MPTTVQLQVKGCLTRLKRLHSEASKHGYSADELEQAMVWLRAWVKRNVDEA